jgi:DNA (cytosine-5)-methyltransferase 1
MAQACFELGLDHVVSAAIDQDADALRVYAHNHAARLQSARSVSEIVDFQCRGRGADTKFLYPPELLPNVFGSDSPRWQSLIGNIDVVLAGPPCQGHSNLNNRTRRDDGRNDLYLTVPAFAIAVGAPIVIIENVPAVVHDRRGVVARTTQLLEEAGYHVTDGVLSSAQMGWPQRRQRYFVIARRDRPPLAVDSVALGLTDEISRSVWWAIGDLEHRAFDDYLHLSTEQSPENHSRIDWLFDNDAHDLPPEERPDCHKNGTTYDSVYGRLHRDLPAPTITTGFMTAGRGRYIHPTQRRTLTPWEAARLQGFPDAYEFRAGGGQPFKHQLAKWIGDAVPMPLGYAAGIAALGSGSLG